ncbi:MAG: transposase [Planctomycetes bacterium]|nr:transposase [Planctomycetota bacterium]
MFETLKRFHRIRFFVLSCCVMPDHFHAIIRPYEKSKGVWWPLGPLVKGIKGASARAINLRRGAKGSLWQDECFDRMIRNIDEFGETWDYIKLNPARAGLTDDKGRYDGLWINSYRDGFVPKAMQ